MDIASPAPQHNLEAMSVGSSGRARRRWLGWVIGMWGGTFLILWWVWPVQPRWTISDGDQYEIIGITPDSQELAAFTYRTVQGDGENDRRPSGPIQFWNLKTGRRRIVPILGQPPAGELPAVPGREFVTRGPPYWRPKSVDRPFCGNWLHFTMWHSEDWLDLQFLAVNVETGETRTFSPRSPRQGYDYELSPSGRWYLESLRNEDELAIHISETASGRPKLSFAKLKDASARFSPDDVYFGCVVQDDQKTSTQIWNVETGTLVRTIDRHVYSLAFSRSHRLMAGWLSASDLIEESNEVELRVWDVESGHVKYTTGPLKDADIPINDDALIEFADDDQRLVYYMNGLIGLIGRIGGPEITEIEFMLAWNLTTGEPPTFPSRDRAREYHPNVCQTGMFPASFPSAYYQVDDKTDTNRLMDVATGRLIYNIPKHFYPKLLTRDAKSLVLWQDWKDSLVRQGVDRLERMGVPIPKLVQSVVPAPSRAWSVIDVPSNRTLATISTQDDITWLSPDERTWVTTSESNIHIWDFPPRTGFLRPLLWSLLAPAIMMLFRKLWCWRKVSLARSRGTG